MAPTNDEIIAATNEVLKNCDITSLTAKSIRLQLEVLFGCELPEAKGVIRDCLERFMDTNEEVVLYASKVKAEVAEDEPIVKKKGGFMAEVQLSTELSEFLGEVLLPRTEVVKRVWAYIKAHELQNPKDKREILCDEALLKVFKVKKIHMFKMTKALSSMMKLPKDLQDGEEDQSEEDEEEQDRKRESKKRKLESNNNNNSSSSSSSSNKKADKIAKKDKKDKKEKKEKKEKVKAEGDDDDVSEPKKGGTFNKPMEVNADLAALIGVNTQCSRPEVVKYLWVYIKDRNLQNPNDKREILLDASLQGILKAKKCTMFSINKLLSNVVKKIEV